MEAIRIKAGDTGTIDFVIKDPQTGSPVNISGATLEFHAVSEPTFSPAVSFHKTNGDGIEITDATHGIGVIEFLATETAPIAGYSGVTLSFDLRVTMPSGDVWTVSSGSLYLAPSAFSVSQTSMANIY